MHPARPRVRWLSLLLLLLPPPLLAATDATGPTRRVAVIGASVSDGFGVRLRAAKPDADGVRAAMPVNVATLLRAAANDPAKTEVVSHTSSVFFAMPDRIAKESVTQTIAEKPSLVLAVDWLFWSSYGARRADGKPIRNCDDRVDRLEHALVTLQPLVETGVTIVLGDLPDMRCAIDGGMLTEAMVPDTECLARLNARIRAWASERPGVALLDVHEVVRRALANQPIRACNRDWCASDLGPLLQRDRLHPTLNGSLAVVAAALQAADTKTDGGTSRAFDLDPAKVRARLAERVSAETKPTSPPDGVPDVEDARPAKPPGSSSVPTAPSAAPPAPPAAAGSSSPSAP